MSSRARPPLFLARAVGAGICLVAATVNISVQAASAGIAPGHKAKVCTLAHTISRWSTKRLTEQLLVIPVDQSALSLARPLIMDGVGGVILMGSPPTSLAHSIADLVRSPPNGIAPLVMADEEGGAVQRLLPAVAAIPSARAMGASMTPGAIEELATKTAVSMRRLGVTMDLAPVADIDARPGPNASNADGTRSFSGVESVTRADVLAFAEGLLRGGVIPVLKHFPGLGGATGNTDLEPADTLNWRAEQRSGLLPFVAAIARGLPAIMISNAVVPGLSRRPASLSRTVITSELRDRLHFRGLIITDSLSVVSIEDAHYSLAQAVVAAIEAGADMVLFNSLMATLTRTTSQIVSAVIAAVEHRTITRSQLVAAALTVLEAKHIDGCRLGA